MQSSILRPIVMPHTWADQPAPCDLFNAGHRLLVKAGNPVPLRLCDTAHPIRVMCAARDAARLSPDDPIKELRDAARSLTLIGQRIAQGQHVSQAEVTRLNNTLLHAWSLDADACLGYTRLTALGGPSVHHALHTALIAAEIGQASGLPRERLDALVGGALTMNLATHALHDTMFAQGRAPDADTRAAIDQHPAASVSLLDHIGHFDAPWLQAVDQHHENIDGSGYPHGLTRTDIALPARCVRVADTFAARLTGRKSRPPLYWNLQQARDLPQLARHIFGHDIDRLDPTLIGQLIRNLGRFPPGGMVRLSNNELAVVTRRTVGPSETPTEVLAIADAKGRALPTPRLRTISQGHFELHIRNYAHDELLRLPLRDWAVLWGYAG